MNIGLQTRYMMETWLSFKVKRKYFSQKPWKAVILTNSTQASLSHQHKPIGLCWHFETGWGDTAMANRNGLARATSRCHQLYYPNVRYNNFITLFHFWTFFHCTQNLNNIRQLRWMVFIFLFSCRCWIDLNSTHWSVHHVEELMRDSKHGRKSWLVQQLCFVQQLGSHQISGCVYFWLD